MAHETEASFNTATNLGGAFGDSGGAVNTALLTTTTLVDPTISDIVRSTAAASRTSGR